MRIGGLIKEEWSTPQEWAKLAIAMGYSAVYFPVDHKSDVSIIDAYISAAKENDLKVAEVGIWNNLLDSDKSEQEKNIQTAIKQLELSEYVGASCCVNISGSKSSRWDGPHKDNLTEKTFEEIVLITQRIIDAVNPKVTEYSLEPMPWMYPDSADSYLRLIKAVDRKGFGVHMDPVNIISSPQKYFENGKIIEEWFQKLGHRICSCHAKDIIISEKLTVHLDECRPGTGALDYGILIREMKKLDKDVCLMLEHMTLKQDYVEAMKFLKSF